MSNFYDNAKELSRNPLGIIALFISLIYGFACLVVSMGIKNIEADLQIFLVLFLIIFPVVVLAAFIYLVVYHHEKLYAPKDFPTEDGFLQSLSLKKQNRKIEKEIREIQNISLDDDKTDILESNQGKEVKCEENKDLQVEKEEINVMNENLQAENENLINTKIELTGTENDANTAENTAVIENVKNEFELRKELILVEDLALRKLQEEIQGTMMRQIMVNYGSHKIDVDGLIRNKRKNYFIEIKYVPNGLLTRNAILGIKKFIEAFDSFESKSSLKLIVTVVHEQGYGEEIRKQLYKTFGTGSGLYQFKLYSVDTLKNHFRIRN